MLLSGVPIRRQILAVAVFTTFWFVGAQARADVATSDKPEVSAYSSSVKAFFRRLRRLADHGDLFKPESVAKQLGMDLYAETEEKTEGECPTSTGYRWHRTTRMISTGETWYRKTSDGVGETAIRGAFTHPTASAGPLQFGYSIYRHVKCNDRTGLMDSTDATVHFAGLPSFACLSPMDVQLLLPGASFHQATDGVSLVWYRGRLDDDVGVAIKFNFREGAKCALSADVSQSQMDGLRYARAEAKHRNCSVQIRRAFCARRGAFGWGNGAALDQMRQAIDDACGTVDQLFKSDTANGTSPAPSPKWKAGAEPCNVYDE